MFLQMKRKKLLITILLLCFSVMLLYACNNDFGNRDNLNARQINIDELCKYNIFLYEGTAVENIGVPLILEYEEGYKESISHAVYLKGFYGENIDGIQMRLQDSLYKWVYNYKNPEEERIYIETFAVSVFTDADYVFSAEKRLIKRVVFGIEEKEYPVNVEIKITDKQNYKGQYQNFRVVSLVAAELTEIPAFNESYITDGNPVIKGIKSEGYYNVVLQRYKKYVPKQSREGVAIKAFMPNELDEAYLKEFAFFDIVVNRTPITNNTFCTGDMLIFEVGEENNSLYTDEVWGLFSLIDYSLAKDIAKAYLHKKAHALKCPA